MAHERHGWRGEPKDRRRWKERDFERVESQNTVLDIGSAGWWWSAPYKNVTFRGRILLPGIHLTRTQVTNTREEVGYLL